MITNASAATTELMSVTTAGDPVSSGNIQVSDNGRFVFFVTDQSNVVPGITSSPWSYLAYVHDRETGSNELVSSDANGTPILVTNTYSPSQRIMSADGRYVMFWAYSQLVYVKDRLTGELKCVSVDSAGNQIKSNLGSISADGGTVSYVKTYREITGVDGRGDPIYTGWNEIYLTNVATGVAAPIISDIVSGRMAIGSTPALGENGRYVAFSSTLQLTAEPLNNNSSGIYVFDTVAKTFDRVDTNATGCVTSVTGAINCDSSGSPMMSSDGRFVSYSMWKARLDSYGDVTSSSQVYVADRTTKTISRADFPFIDEYGGIAGGETATISADGGSVIFMEYTGRLNATGAGVRDVFVFEKATGNIARVDLSTSGEAANSEVYGFSVSGNASIVMFSSNASNLVAGVSTANPAIFVRNTDAQGYPLSFTVTKAEYNTTSRTLTVEATSTKGALASLVALNLGAMTWNSAKNLWTYSGTATAQPESVFVGNIEGYKTVPVVTASTSTVADKVAPVVVSSTPAKKATGVSTSSTVAINFSEAIAKGSNFASITIKKGSTAIKVVCSISGNKLTINPSNALSKKTSYTVTIPAKAIKDAAGNQFAASYSFSFTTGSK
jgi:methionine-rich copper-binding protein CopC